MNEAIKQYTPKGKIKRPSYSLVATWIKEAWDNIDTAMIQRSFKCCGISTKLDGSEDNLIFDFEKVPGVSGVRIGVEEDQENSELVPEDIECDPEDDYYENEEGNYINVWE